MHGEHPVLYLLNLPVYVAHAPSFVRCLALYLCIVTCMNLKPSVADCFSFAVQVESFGFNNRVVQPIGTRLLTKIILKNFSDRHLQGVLGQR